MTDLTATVDTYLSAFCEPDRGRRTGLVDAVWRPTVACSIGL